MSDLEMACKPIPGKRCVFAKNAGISEMWSAHGRKQPVAGRNRRAKPNSQGCGGVRVIPPGIDTTGPEAYMFKFNFDTDAPKIFAETEDYPQSSMDFMTGVSLYLRPFKNHGGKLIISSSVNDGIS